MTDNEKNIRQTAFTVTNFSADYSISGTEAGAANIAAVLATLIRDLSEKGVINPSAAVS